MRIINRRNLTIYTVAILIFVSIVFELGYCNTNLIVSIRNKEEILYNFSICRIIAYTLIILLYLVYKNKFIDIALETMENKYKNILTKLVILIVLINFIFMLIYIMKVNLDKANIRTISIEIITLFLTSLFVIYISNDFSKNVIITACTFGIIFAITTNFNHAIDEKRHFMTAFNVSFFNFNYIDKPITDETIEKLPQISKYTMIDEFLESNYEPKITEEVNKQDIPSLPADYSFVMYIFSGLGIFIARILNGTIIDIYIAGRLMNLILYTILISIAIKILPFKRNIFYMVAFMPFMLLLAASYSIDGICLGILFIFIAYCLKIYKENNIITLKEFVILVTLFFIMLIGKGIGYIFVATIVFILPIYNTIKKNKKYMPIFAFCTIFFIIFAILFFIYLKNENITSQGDSRGGEGINPIEQQNYILGHPIHDLKLAMLHVRETLLCFEWYENLHPSAFFTNYSKSIFFIMMLYILFISITEDDYNLKIKDKIICIISFLLVYGMTSGILYLVFTPVGALYVAGYQARYIFPILPLLLVCISNKNIKIVKAINRNMNSALGIGAFLFIGIIQLILV